LSLYAVNMPGMMMPNFITNLPKGIAVVLTAAMPVLELRGAIPLGLFFFHLSLPKVYLLSVFGNILPVIPLLYIYHYFFSWLSRFRIFRWWVEKVQKRSGIVKKLYFWGLVIFVSIPLPVTGAWTGALAASLCKIGIRKSFFAILLGVLLAGIIVSLVSLGVINAYVFIQKIF